MRTLAAQYPLGWFEDTKDLVPIVIILHENDTRISAKGSQSPKRESPPKGSIAGGLSLVFGVATRTNDGQLLDLIKGSLVFKPYAYRRAMPGSDKSSLPSEPLDLHVRRNP